MGHLPGFRFPSEQYFRDVLPRVWGNMSIRLHLQEFFNNISIRFSTDASETELATQADRVLKRIPAEFSRKRTPKWDNIISCVADDNLGHMRIACNTNVRGDDCLLSI